MGNGISNDAAGELVAARAYRLLEELIVTLRLAPGALTTEKALIEQLSLGRTPVREAIQRLAWEGLVSVRPRAGLEIAPLHASDWARVLEARRGVEIVLAEHAARFVSRVGEDTFHDAALAMRDAVLRNDVNAFLAADKSVDDAISLAADNPFATLFVSPLRTHSRRFWYRYQSGTGLAEAASHHVALIQAILNGDEASAAEQAGQLMALLGSHAQAAATR